MTTKIISSTTTATTRTSSSLSFQRGFLLTSNEKSTNKKNGKSERATSKSTFPKTKREKSTSISSTTSAASIANDSPHSNARSTRQSKIKDSNNGWKKGFLTTEKSTRSTRQDDKKTKQIKMTVVEKKQNENIEKERKQTLAEASAFKSNKDEEKKLKMVVNELTVKSPIINVLSEEQEIKHETKNYDHEEEKNVSGDDKGELVSNVVVNTTIPMQQQHQDGDGFPSLQQHRDDDNEEEEEILFREISTTTSKRRNYNNNEEIVTTTTTRYPQSQDCRNNNDILHNDTSSTPSPQHHRQEEQLMTVSSGGVGKTISSKSNTASMSISQFQQQLERLLSIDQKQNDDTFQQQQQQQPLLWSKNLMNEYNISSWTNAQAEIALRFLLQKQRDEQYSKLSVRTKNSVKDNNNKSKIKNVNHRDAIFQHVGCILLEVHTSAYVSIMQKADTEDDRIIALHAVILLQEFYNRQPKHHIQEDIKKGTNYSRNNNVSLMVLPPLMKLALQSRRTVLAQTSWTAAMQISVHEIQCHTSNVSSSPTVNDNILYELQTLLKQQLIWQREQNSKPTTTEKKKKKNNRITNKIETLEELEKKVTFCINQNYNEDVCHEMTDMLQAMVNELQLLISS